MALFGNLSALAEFIAVRGGLYSDQDLPRLHRTFLGMTSADERSAFLSIVLYKGYLSLLLPVLEVWRDDPVIVAKLQDQIPKFRGKQLFDLLLFVARPNDSKLEESFCHALDEFFATERTAIRKYCQDYGDTSGATEWDEELGAYITALSAVLRFATLGYTRPFQKLPKVQAKFGKFTASIFPLAKAVIQGNFVTEEMLRAFVPEELLQPKASRTPAPDWALYEGPHAALPQYTAHTAPSIVAPKPRPSTIRSAILNLRPGVATEIRLEAIQTLDELLFARELAEVGKFLTEDETIEVARAANEVHLRYLQHHAGTLSALNAGLDVWNKNPRLVAVHSLWALLMEFGAGC